MSVRTKFSVAMFDQRSCSRKRPRTNSSHFQMFLLPYIPLLFLASSIAKKSAKTNDSIKENLITLAAKNNGLIRLDDDMFNLITSPDREWSVIVQFTALTSSYKCEPCKYVIFQCCPAVLLMHIRQLDPVFVAMGKAWNKVKPDDRNQHFFASIDFDSGKETFRAVSTLSYSYIRTDG